MKNSEKNRFQNAFTVCIVALDSVDSDMFGKSATVITDYLISKDTFNPEYCVSLLQCSLKKNADSVLESIEGYSITNEQKFRMKIVRSHLNYIENLISEVDSAIDTMVAKHESLISLLGSIPGLDRNSAITVISEFGNDVSQFDSSKRLCRWAGLTPKTMNLSVKRSPFVLPCGSLSQTCARTSRTRSHESNRQFLLPP